MKSKSLALLAEVNELQPFFHLAALLRGHWSRPIPLSRLARRKNDLERRLATLISASLGKRLRLLGSKMQPLLGERSIFPTYLAWALYDFLGNKDERKKFDNPFKKAESNFKITIVVNMWLRNLLQQILLHPPTAARSRQNRAGNPRPRNRDRRAS